MPPPPSKLGYPLHENYGHISNIYKEDILVKDISILPIKFGKTPLSRLKTIYEKLYLDEFQVLPRVFLNGKDGGVLKSLLKEYSEVQITVLMITHFNWFGADGKSDWDHAKLEKAAFPLTWISPNLNPYINYINGSYKVEFTNEDAVLKFVRDYLKKLSTD